MTSHITFIGGGNMASAIIGGLLRQGMTIQQIDVVEPYAEARDKLQAQFGITALHGPGPALAKASLVVWAVKPQTFKEAALQTRYHTKQALHLSVAAGIRSDSIASWLGTQRIVRAMPNTPALVGKGMTALYGRPAVTEADRALVNQVMTPTGQFLWVADEETAGRGHRPLGLRSRLRLLLLGSHDAGRGGHGPEPRAQAHQPGVGDLRRRLGTRGGIRRPARSVAPARDLQGGNDLRGPPRRWSKTT
jgi:hypothetical protein